MPRYGQSDSAYGSRLRSTAADGPIYMLGLTKFRPEYRRDGGLPSAAGRAPGGSSYAPAWLLTSAGAALCFAAAVVASSGHWDRVAVVGYPTRRSFVELAYQRDFQAWHVAREDRMERTTVMGTLPVGGLPGLASSGRILLEAWSGEPPQPVAAGTSTARLPGPAARASR